MRPAMTRSRIWLVGSIAVAGVVLAVSGAVAVGSFVANEAELAASNLGHTESDAGERSGPPSTLMSPYPAPSPLVYVPKAPAPDGPLLPTTPPKTVVRGAEAAVEEPREEAPAPETNDDTGLGGEAPAPTAALELGVTTDQLGVTHALTLNVSASAYAAIAQAETGFAVVSGGSKFSVSGDVAVDSWRMFVDSQITGQTAPIVVFKSTRGGTMQQLASSPSAYSAASELNEDVLATSTRLSGLIADVIAKAEQGDGNGSVYGPLAERLVDPMWTGVMIFNAKATVPDEVIGHPSGVLAGSDIDAVSYTHLTLPTILRV